jgi:glycosyltransferase involved in cell wall biosynthesis
MSTISPAENKNQVSIICRTLDRPVLQQALQSIASQDYPNIEIVLVDAIGNNSLDSTASGDRPLVLVTTGSALSRSAAANAGLKAAHGKYIQFLDDDDWIDPNHVSQLVSVLENSDDTAAAYSSTQKTNATGDSLDYVFREAFDPILLMRDNYIPIHAILFDASLLEHGCRFDEAFDIYEDWDFWLQLSQHTDFQHIDSITAYYREGGDSDTAVEDVRLRYQADNLLGKGRAAIFEKWLPKWTGERVNSLIGQLDQSVLLCEQDAQIHRELQRNAELQHGIEKRDTKMNERDIQINELDIQINERDIQINERDIQINELDIQINELDLQILNSVSQLEQLQLHSERQAQHVSELELRLNTIYDSASWKLMGPIRRVGRTLTADKNSESDSSASDK